MKPELTQCPTCWTSPSIYASTKPCALHQFVEKDAGPMDTQACDPDESPVVRAIKFPPDAADGDHWCIVAVDDNRGLLNMLDGWVDGAEVGSKITIELIETTRREIERLPEI